jgi:hypothetical protein
MPRRASAAVLGTLILLDLAVTVVLGRGAAGAPPSIAATASSAGARRQAFETQARARSSAPAYVPTYSTYLSPLTFRSGPWPVNAAISAGHPVWMVTVYYPNGGCEGCTLERPMRRHKVYSVVYDGSTGREVDFCGGCQWVKESRSDTVDEHLRVLVPDWLTIRLAWLLSLHSAPGSRGRA